MGSASWHARVALLGLAACASAPVVTSKPLPSPVRERKLEKLDSALLESLFAEEHANDAYRVGPGDSLLIAVFRHPELAIATYSGASAGISGGRAGGVVIDNDGTIQYPMIGRLAVAGKTTGEVAAMIQDGLGRFIVDPTVTVQVQYYGSVRYVMMGQFARPGVLFADRPMRLMEAIAMAGGINESAASLRRAYIARSGKKLPVDFESLILDGDLRYDIPMRPNDLIFIPNNNSDQVFVFGEAGNGIVPFVNGKLTLMQALASLGLGSANAMMRSHFDEIRIIRSGADHAEFLIVDVEGMFEGEVGAFFMEPGDIVYVPPTGLTTWNEVLKQILPSLQATSTIMTPFVQIRVIDQLITDIAGGAGS
ncbi:MAG: polysaccharide biosynthesis/export family protein [Deltaproteobacteria bacterium]|nr:polysaccharide biosynthesis/export family protein [Deltaproteobacteria bacterium]